MDTESSARWGCPGRWPPNGWREEKPQCRADTSAFLWESELVSRGGGGPRGWEYDRPGVGKSSGKTMTRTAMATRCSPGGGAVLPKLGPAGVTTHVQGTCWTHPGREGHCPCGLAEWQSTPQQGTVTIHGQPGGMRQRRDWDPGLPHSQTVA